MLKPWDWNAGDVCNGLILGVGNDECRVTMKANGGLP